MHRIQKWLREFFSISHAQANGIMVLLPLLGSVLLSEPLWHWYITQRPRDYSADRAVLDSMIVQWNLTSTGLQENQKNSNPPKYELSAFNPNTAVRESLMKVGFPEKLAARIVAFRKSGGRFKVRSDLLKIYGMDSALYQTLYRFILLPSTVKRDTTRSSRPFVSFAKKVWVEKPAFDINSADTIQLKEIQGIGSKLSARIIKYRNALGGFTSNGQLAEVFGLDSIVINRLSKKTFVDQNFVPVKINLNTAPEAILAGHPYFSKSEAKSIVAYRFQHGEFKSIEDLTSVSTLKENTIRRIKPYLTITDR